MHKRLKLFIVIFILILLSISAAVYIFKAEAPKKTENPILSTKIEQTPIKTFTPTPVPTPRPSPSIKTVSAYTILINRLTAKQTAKQTTPPAPKTTKAPGPKVAGIPVRIQIPRIGMNAAVEQVGMEADGAMSAPKSWWTVGWYNLGYKIGDAGSAVMSGHYDTNTGAPAVFFRVKNLSVGDIMTVTNSNGSVFKYRVSRVESYPWDQVPLQSIFNSAGKVQLNLITCSGTWDKVTQNYSHRTVIYSDLTN